MRSYQIKMKNQSQKDKFKKNLQYKLDAVHRKLSNKRKYFSENAKLREKSKPKISLQ